MLYGRVHSVSSQFTVGQTILFGTKDLQLLNSFLLKKGHDDHLVHRNI